MRLPLLSVIIPVYKVADYLDRCVDSIINQSYDNLEIILVDDGSPDDCAQKCDEWTEKDDRITVIHKQNGGLSDARNHGMQFISGEYVSFIDGDDYVSEDYIGALFLSARKTESDIIECEYVKFSNQKECEITDKDYDEYCFSALDGLSALIDETYFTPIVCNKLFKKTIIQNVFFEIGKYHEDVFWTYQVFGKSKRITKINRIMYFYFQRESSIMGQTYNLRRLDSLEGKWNRQKYIEENYPDLILQAKLDFFGSCMYALQCVLKNMSGYEKRKAITVIRKYKKMCRLSFKDISSVKGAIKKYYYLAKINIYLCCKLRVLRGIE